MTNDKPPTTMLSATEISSALKQSLADGEAMCVVSLMETDGRPATQVARLLVKEGGATAGGSLGNRALDDVAARRAVALMKDERQEIVVASLSELGESVASPSSGIGAEGGTRIGDTRLLFEISRPPLELIICGGGHVGQAVAKAGALLDFKITVIDDRPEFASRNKFPDPGVRLITGDFTEALRAMKITQASHVVIVTRGHRHDEICLREVIEKPARYIGMIGSRRRATTIREHMRREGVGAEHLRRVHSPIGLDIGAITPEEIALAILAEITLARRGGSGAPKGAEGPMARAR
ncbi:MAG TPA: XdhC family protein [Blastocatellia bacterium]|nr:XdhC family protein [Blastocatellia bacterium]